MVENTLKNEGADNFEKHIHFRDVHFSLDEKHILETVCKKQHASLVDPLRDLNGFFECSHSDVFLTSHKGAKTKKRDRN